MGMDDSTISTVASAHDTCEEYFKVQGMSDLLRELSKGKISAEDLEVHHNMLLHGACKEGFLCTVQYILSQRLADINCRGRSGRTPVMVAARYKHVAVFDFLVSQDCDLGAVDDYNDTVLHVACMGGNTDIIQTLLKVRKYNINIRGNYWWTPVMVSAFWGQWKAYELLVSKGSNMSLLDNFHCNILHITCQGGNVDILGHILSQNIIGVDSKGYKGITPLMFAAQNGHIKAYVVLEKRSCDLKAVDESKRNVLHAACIAGQLDMVRYILSQKIHDIESRAYKEMTPVMVTAEHGHVEVLDILIDAGCNLKAVDSVKNSILHVACCGGHVDMVKRIFSLAIMDIDTKGHKGRTPLMIAVECGHQEVIDFLITKGCNLKALDEQGNNILHLGCSSGHTDIVKYILSRGIADMDSKGYKGRTPVMMAAIDGNQDAFGILMSMGCHLSVLDEKKNTVLHIASLLGHIDMVKGILSRSMADLESKGYKGRTPIMVAARHGNQKVIDLLISKGCNLRDLDEQGNNILHLGCLSGHIDVVKGILSRGIVDVQNRGYNGRTPVMLAAESGHQEVIELLISNGCNLRVVDEQRYNILHIGCSSGNLNVVKYILSLGIVNIESRGDKCKTPVMIVAEMGHLDIFDLLVSYDCHLSAVDEENNNVLHIACISGHVHMVEYILSHEIADINGRGYVGRTPVMLAAENGHKEVVELLVRKGCNMILFDKERRNILHVACVYRHVDIVKYIVSLNIVNIDSTSSKRRTAVMIAALMGQKDIVELLVSKGCNLRILDEQKNNILHVACMGGHVEVVRYVLSLDIFDVDCRGFGRQTPVLLAAQCGHVEVVKLLRSRGSDLRALGTPKNNILHLASMGGDVDVVRYIISQDIAHIDSRQYVGKTPVMLAAQCGHKDVVKLLWRRGCNLKALDKRKNNILHLACFGGNEDVVKYILQQNIIDIESKGYGGRTPVMVAAEAGHRGLLEVLVNKGCNLKARDQQGNTILHVACLGGHVDMVRYLLTHRVASRQARNLYHMTPVQMAESEGHGTVVALFNNDI